MPGLNKIKNRVKILEIPTIRTIPILRHFGRRPFSLSFSAHSTRDWLRFAKMRRAKMHNFTTQAEFSDRDNDDVFIFYAPFKTKPRLKKGERERAREVGRREGRRKEEGTAQKSFASRLRGTFLMPRCDAAPFSFLLFAAAAAVSRVIVPNSIRARRGTIHGVGVPKSRSVGRFWIGSY